MRAVRERRGRDARMNRFVVVRPVAVHHCSAPPRHPHGKSPRPCTAPRISLREDAHEMAAVDVNSSAKARLYDGSSLMIYRAAGSAIARIVDHEKAAAQGVYGVRQGRRGGVPTASTAHVKAAPC